jgi:predicted DNA-binding protein YlxM (UPF0122 family)
MQPDHHESEPTDNDLLNNSYEAVLEIYSACERREELPERLQKALETHQPLVESLARRCAP